MKSKTINSLVYMLTAMLLAACTGGTFMYEYHDTPMWGWEQTDTITFDLPAITASGEVEAQVGVRYTKTYRYKELLMLGTLVCDGNTVQTDTIAISVYRDNGVNEGQGFPFTTQMQAATTFQVDSGHVYRFQLSHLMQPTPVKGICGIGVKLRSK
ncbi:MAG: hypothetical protein J5770_03770 [Bacteroidaceae bacterium]|nr:hypothetical protein [Bacteroidaceae bacterium]MBR4855776.1 hypothetical protein [Bacteroidaceae bacterium]